MTRINLSGVRQLGEHAQGLDNLEHAATRQVRPSYATPKQSVASESNILLSTVIHHATLRVTRGVDYLERMRTKLHLIAVIHALAYRR